MINISSTTEGEIIMKNEAKKMLHELLQAEASFSCVVCLVRSLSSSTAERKSDFLLLGLVT